jgi:superfamily II DNA or RNA helicase
MTELVRAFDALSGEEQAILRVLSVICEPVNQTTLQQVLDMLGWTGADGTPLARWMGKSLRERLLEQGLLEKHGNALACHPDLLEPLTRATVADGSFGEIVSAAERIVPTRMRNAWDRPTDERRFRMLRVALYGGREDEVLRMLGVEHEPSLRKVRYAQVEPLVRVCSRSPDLAWLSRLPPRLRVLAVAPLLQDAALDLVARPGLQQLMEHLLAPLAAEHCDAADALAEQRLLRARLNDVAGLLAGRDDGEALILIGWLRFLEGDYAAAINAFEAALTTIRKLTRKRSLYLPGIPGVLHLLSLLQRGRPEDYTQVQDLVAICLRASVTDRVEAAYKALGDLAKVLAGRQRLDDSVWLLAEMMPAAPFPMLIHCLARKWLGQRPQEAGLALLAKAARAATDAGLVWYAREAASLLDALGFKAVPTPPEAPDRLVLMTELLSPRPSWEIALEALKGLAGKDAEAHGDGADRRLVWLLTIDDGYGALEPREQKRTKRGGWTQGRAVALQRLTRDGGGMDYLTPQDQEICACIVREQEASWYGGQVRTHYRLDQERALLAAVGHPLVLRPGVTDGPIELIEGGPTLAVVRRSKDILVSIEPFPPASGSLLAVPETAQRVRLVQFDAGHQRIAQILGPDGLSVPAGAELRLLEGLAAVAPMLTVHSDIGGGESAAEQVEADPRPHLHLNPVDGGLSLELAVHPFGDGGPQLPPGHGRAILFTQIAGRAVRCTRDLAAERDAAAAVLEHCPALDGIDSWSWTLDDPELALGALEQLQAMGDAVVLDWPQGKRIGLSKEVQVGQMRVAVKRQGDWFDITGGLTLDDGRVMAMRELLERTAASRGRYVRLGEDDFLVLSNALRRRLDSLRGLTDDGRFHPLAAPVVEEALDGMQQAREADWDAQLARLAEMRDLEPELPSTLQAQLRDYQVEGFRWLSRLAHWGAGACLADDMGLGKTVQALALILSRAPQGPTLVLAPMSVCGNWLDEASRFAPTLNPQRFGPGDRQAMLDAAGPFDLVVASYGLLQTEGERLASVQWQTIVADEAQAFKNALTKRSQAIMRLRGAFRIITTGTPIENHLGELWNLFRFINPGLLGSLDTFNRRYAIPIEQDRDQGARGRLRAMLRPFILRRLKSDVLTELPPRTEITLRLELSDGEQALYEAMRREAIERLDSDVEKVNAGQKRMILLAEIMRLRRVCCHPKLALPDSELPSAKLEAFHEIVDELLDNRHKALVFSQFVDHLQLIRADLDARGVRYQYLDGATPERHRRAAVSAFQAGEGDLFLISLRAGGAGLNLTAADYVIHMDPWWNPAVEDQASDRAHRIGQQRPVTIYRLVAKDSIEERIIRLHAAKRDLADGLLAGTEDGGRLSYEDMLELIRAPASPG